VKPPNPLIDVAAPFATVFVVPVSLIMDQMPKKSMSMICEVPAAVLS